MKLFKVTITDMSINRGKAKEKLEGRSETFQTHFAKNILYPNDQSAPHWKGEMSTLLLLVSNITVKPNGKRLKKQELLNWFFYCDIDIDADYRRLLNEAVIDENRISEYTDKDVAKFKEKYKEFSEQMSTMISSGNTTDEEIRTYVKNFDFS